MQTLTFFEVSDILEDELQLLKKLEKPQTEKMKPKKATLDFITNYSKAYSARPSKTVGHIETVLN